MSKKEIAAGSVTPTKVQTTQNFFVNLNRRKSIQKETKLLSKQNSAASEVSEWNPYSGTHERNVVLRKKNNTGLVLDMSTRSASRIQLLQPSPFPTYPTQYCRFFLIVGKAGLQ